MNENNNSDQALEWIVKDLNYILTHLDHCIAQSSLYPPLNRLQGKLESIRTSVQATIDKPLKCPRCNGCADCNRCGKHYAFLSDLKWLDKTGETVCIYCLDG